MTADMRERVDVLLVRGDTTLGLRRGDNSLAAALRRVGCTVAEVTPDYRVTRLLRATRISSRLGVTPDFTQSLDACIATAAAVRVFQPRSIIYSPCFAASLQPKSRLGVTTAIRFDSPMSMSRRGRRGAALTRALERRAFRATGLLLPWGVNPAETLLAELSIGARVVPLPVPIEAGKQDAARLDIAVTYASSNPHKKGLDLVLSAWCAVRPETMRLAVTGIRRDAALRWCRRRRIEVPDTVDWLGPLEPEAWRRLLRTSSYYLAGSRYEDHGIAQLEALASGVLLVTVPSAGPFEPLALAKGLPGELVADEIGPQALAAALRRASALSEEVRALYRASARAATAVYSEQTLDERLRNEVLPQLLQRNSI